MLEDGKNVQSLAVIVLDVFAYNTGLLVVPKIGIWSRIRNFPKKRSDLSRFSEHWWNSDLFRPLNFENQSFGSKVMHFCSIFSFKMLKARKCSEFVLNFVSFGAFYYEKWLKFRKCSELVPNFTLCRAFNLEKNWLLELKLENVIICIVKNRKCSELVQNLTFFSDVPNTKSASLTTLLLWNA